MAQNQIVRSMLRRVYAGYPSSVQASWSVSAVRSALDSHEQGQFGQSAQIADAMGRDDRIPGVLSTRILGLLQADFELESESEEENARAAEVRDVIERQWQAMLPETELASLLRWYLLLGVGLGQIVWETGQGQWTPRLVTMHPQYLRREESTGRWLYLTTDGEVEIRAGDGKWVLLTNGSDGYMGGLVRQLATPWLVRSYNWRDWSRRNERHGMPLILAKVPSVADGDEKQDFFEDLKALATETTIMLPQGLTEDGQGFGVELLESQSDAWQTFAEMRLACDTSIAVCVLGQNLSTEVQGGSYAAAVAQSAILAQRIRADEQVLTTVLREQFVSPFVRVNYGPEPELVPWPHWCLEPPRDTGAEVQSIAALMRAIEDASSTARLVDVPMLLERYGVPVAPEDQRNERGRVFQYHLNFGVLTTNEIRERLGLPPIAGGDVPPEPKNATAQEALSEARQAAETYAGEQDSTRLQAMRQASRGEEALIAGATKHDRIASDTSEMVAKLLADDLGQVLATLDSARDYDELETMLRERYASLDAEPLGELMARALTLAELTGRRSILAGA